MRQWRLIYDYPSPGEYNMAVDEVILMAASERPTLRLYAWEPHCLSLGYGQSSRDVARARLDTAGYDLVRRATGGRAVLHAHELTYSLILPPDHPIAAGGVIPSYRRISQALLAGLNQLGVRSEAKTQASQPGANGPVCFETPSHYEVTANGRKLIGSAQLRRKAGVLQHGSLLLSGDIGAICDVLHYPDEASRAAAQQQVRRRATTLSAALRSVPISWQAAADTIAQGFRETFDIELIPGVLSEYEREQAQQLVRTVYGNLAWTERR